MKISELIKRLNTIMEDSGDLEVGMYKDDESGQYGEYFADIEASVIITKYNKVLYERWGEYKPVNVDKFCGIC